MAITCADEKVGSGLNCRRLFSVLLLGLVCLAAEPNLLQAADPEFTTRRPELDRMLVEIMATLGAEPTDCKARTLTHPMVHALCGNAPAAMKRKGDALRAEVGRLLEQVASAKPSGDGWQIGRRLSESYFMVRGVRVTVVIKHKTAEVSLMYVPDGTACLSPEAREGAVDASLLTSEEGFERPVLASSSQPDYPEAARVEPRNGMVLMGYRVEASGEVSEVCVGMSDDRGINYAFSRAAMAGWKKNRYKPARLNGEPVAVIGSVIQSFWIEGRIPRP